MPNLKELKGKLLIAEPSILNDDSFNRAIILITEHTQKNSVGFILNKPLHFTLNDLLPDIDSDFIIYQGGPVEQDNLYFVHKVPELIPDSIAVENGIYWGGNFEALKALLITKTLNKSDIRFFLGYSGWGQHQLLNEINTSSWFVADNNSENIFSENEKLLWRNKLLEKGGDYKFWVNAPSDVSLN